MSPIADISKEGEMNTKHTPTYYENLLGMLRDAEEIRAICEASGDKDRAALWAVKIALHKAEIRSYEHQ